jgi:phosphatidylinositol alpha-1,6-mannosyltransferase
VLSHRLASNFQRAEVHVVTLDGEGAGDFDRRISLRVTRVGLAAMPRPARVAALNAAVVWLSLRFRPDVVLCMHVALAPSAFAVRGLLSAPVALYLHAVEVRRRQRLARWATRRADAVIAVSSHTEGLARSAGAPEERLHRIPPGVDLPTRRLPRDGAPTVLTVARLTERYKGHDVLARALPLVRAQVPDVRWVVIGDGPLRPEVDQLVAEHGLTGSVQLLGSVPDALRDEWLDRAHVFALPSRVPADAAGGEGFGIVYLEAAAHGLPVVAANQGGTVDAVVDQETGLLVDPADHVAVAEAIAALLLDRERARALGDAAARRAAGFAWRDIARGVEDLLLELSS